MACHGLDNYTGKNRNSCVLPDDGKTFACLLLFIALILYETYYECRRKDNRLRHESIMEGRHESIMESRHESIMESRHESIMEGRHESIMESRHEVHKIGELLGYDT